MPATDGLIWTRELARLFEAFHCGEDLSESTTPLVQPFVVGPYLVRQPVTRRQRFEEGWEMRHYVLEYFEEMMSGALVLLSIRDSADPEKRIATAELTLPTRDGPSREPSATPTTLSARRSWRSSRLHDNDCWPNGPRRPILGSPCETLAGPRTERFQMPKATSPAALSAAIVASIPVVRAAEPAAQAHARWIESARPSPLLLEPRTIETSAVSWDDLGDSPSAISRAIVDALFAAPSRANPKRQPGLSVRELAWEDCEAFFRDGHPTSDPQSRAPR